jgi:hypothetical protein
MASLNGPFLSRTCAVGKGLTFHALLFKLSRRSSLWALPGGIGRGTLPKVEFGRSAPPATVAAVDTNCLRVIAPPNLIKNSSLNPVSMLQKGWLLATFLGLIGLFCTQKPVCLGLFSVRFGFVF